VGGGGGWGAGGDRRWTDVVGGGLKAQITDALVPPVLWLCCVCCFSPLLGCVSLLCFFGGQDFMKTSLSSERTFFKVCRAVGRTLSSKGMPVKKIGRRLFGARELTLVFLLLRAADTTCRAVVVPPSLYPSFFISPVPPLISGSGRASTSAPSARLRSSFSMTKASRTASSSWPSRGRWPSSLRSTASANSTAAAAHCCRSWTTRKRGSRRTPPRSSLRRLSS